MVQACANGIGCWAVPSEEAGLLDTFVDCKEGIRDVSMGRAPFAYGLHWKMWLSFTNLALWVLQNCRKLLSRTWFLQPEAG